MRDYALWVDDTPAITVPQIRSQVRKLKQHIANGRTVPCNRLAVIVVDYLQLCDVTTTKGKSREQVVGEVSRGLKTLSKQEDVCVIALSQLNRLVETRGKDKRPQLSDLRESGSIEQDADAVIFVFRPEMYLKQKDPAMEGWAEIDIAKQRNGPTKRFKLGFAKEYCRFDPLEDGDLDLYDPADTDNWYEDGSKN